MLQSRHSAIGSILMGDESLNPDELRWWYIRSSPLMLPPSLLARDDLNDMSSDWPLMAILTAGSSKSTIGDILLVRFLGELNLVILNRLFNDLWWSSSSSSSFRMPFIDISLGWLCIAGEPSRGICKILLGSPPFLASEFMAGETIFWLLAATDPGDWLVWIIDMLVGRLKPATKFAASTILHICWRTAARSSGVIASVGFAAGFIPFWYAAIELSWNGNGC